MAFCLQTVFIVVSHRIAQNCPSGSRFGPHMQTSLSLMSFDTSPDPIPLTLPQNLLPQERRASIEYDVISATQMSLPNDKGAEIAGPDIAGPDIAGLDIVGLDIAGLDIGDWRTGV